jgi:hypothetical protein
MVNVQINEKPSLHAVKVFFVAGMKFSRWIEVVK